MLGRLSGSALRAGLFLLVAAAAPSSQVASAAELIPCGQVPELKSPDRVTFSVPLIVKNDSHRAMSVNWIDSHGAKIPKAELAPGQEMPPEDSYACDAWLLETPAGKCLCGVVLEGRPEVVSVDANGLCRADRTKTSYEPTANYRQQKVEGWTVLISSAYTGEALRPVLAELERKLKEARMLLPPDAIKRLQQVRLWLEHSDCQFPGSAYHPDKDWLRKNNMNPDKAGNIQISAEIVTLSKEQPAMVIHELAHALEARAPGPDRTELEDAYRAAKRSGRYASVRRRGGGKERAYAMRDVHEYFAELSEAYFSENDYFPFNRVELKAFDPKGFAAVENLWNGAKPSPP